MAKYVPSKDLEELKPRVGNIIYKLLGYSDPSLVAVIMNCITAGHDKKRMTGMYFVRKRAILFFFDVLMYGIDLLRGPVKLCIR